MKRIIILTIAILAPTVSLAGTLNCNSWGNSTTCNGTDSAGEYQTFNSNTWGNSTVFTERHGDRVTSGSCGTWGNSTQCSTSDY